MSLVDQQSSFTEDIIKLLTFAYSKGFKVTMGEGFRTIEQQELHYKAGRSKTMNSQHLKRLAHDFNFFKVVDGKNVYIENKQELQELGDYWESLHKLNRWGGNWKSIVDCPHFERFI